MADRWRAKVTIALVAINLAVYVLERVAPGLGLASRFLNSNERIADGESFRLLTSAFIHASPSHVAGNMLGLLICGASTEAVLGRWRFTGLYMLAALWSSMSVYLLKSAGSGSFGASGAVYGVISAWAVTVWGRDGISKVLVADWVVYAACAAVIQPTTTTVQHVAGCTTGLVLALGWRPGGPRRWRTVTLGNAVAVCLTVTLVAAGALRTVDARRRMRPWTDSTGTTTAASVGLDGPSPSPAANASEASISADGRLVAFTSTSSDVLSLKVNGGTDVFLRDLAAGSFVRVSVAHQAGQSSGSSDCPMLSADGRFVVFGSYATDLVVPPGAPGHQLFVRDVVQGTTSQLTVPGSGGQLASCPSISADGHLVAFLGSADVDDGSGGQRLEIFAHDRASGVTTAIAPVGTLPPALGPAQHATRSRPVLSGDGRFIAFVSEAPDLVPGDTNGHPDVFVHDRQTGRTTAPSLGRAGSPGFCDAPSLSADGRFVAFRSTQVKAETSDKVDVFVHDRITATTTRQWSARRQDQPSAPVLSPDGRYVAFQTRVPFGEDRTETVVIDRRSRAANRVSVGFHADGSLGLEPPSFSADGRFVAFESGTKEEGVVTIFVHDRLARVHP